ncbi:MAG TPA: RdgB/HAM1 family non-canonical purine NTP pyrophosphatase [Flavisolibacter sp.]|nr:RdgB/HAM1 family non-canonical purine NTP pyrophosphatase [Flavisolibacter sp.]
MKLIFATNNTHKITEVRSALPVDFEILTLQEAGIDIDIPEPHDTLEENAQEKATTIYHLTNTSCFSEDAGLEVLVLNGEPGVHSARYAGVERSSRKNIEKLLQNLTGQADRQAQFRAVICLVMEGNIDFFEGVCEGRISESPKGAEGFGYDPVFVPDGAEKTFAEMSMEEKNVYSHRRKAIDKLIRHLTKGTQR